MLWILDDIAYRGVDKAYYLMTAALTVLILVIVLLPVSKPVLKRMWRQSSGRIGLAFLFGHLFLAVVAPLVILHGPFTQHDLGDVYRYHPPNSEFWLGTDSKNRDFLARILSGGRPALSVTFVTALLAVTWGTFAGILLALSSARVDAWVMRFVDAMISIPSIAFLMLAIASVGSTSMGGFLFIPIAGFFSGLSVLRVVRAQAQTIVALDYVSAARARGHSLGWIALHEVLPNCRDVVLVELPMRWSWLLLTFAGASFFGLLVQIPTPDWSSMIAGSRTLFLAYPNIFWPPVAMLSSLIIGINFTADSLSKALGLDRSAADMM